MHGGVHERRERKRTGYDHDVALSGRSTEDDPESILVVPSGGHVHHLDGAACQSERLVRPTMSAPRISLMCEREK